ncbi:TetR/AcrR family transcriptional regulator [Streptomyces sp. NPDC058195]|uniref:TetR/AcrR family transcriptional regulator n=1 Tax=Streptomyces sp. NPDC058195 TaxID=3346375 RepID=UPI0036ED21F5
MAALPRTPSVPSASSASSASSAPGAAKGVGLRERKKLRTRTEIRRAAYRLFSEQGYEATTVERIAAAAEVSPSTVSRYFPAKEDIVLTGEYDAALETALRARPAGEPPLESLRHVLARALTDLTAAEDRELRQRALLLARVPALRVRTAQGVAGTARVLACAFAARTGRTPGDLAVRVSVTAALGALREAVLYWGERGGTEDLAALVDEAVAAVAAPLSP